MIPFDDILESLDLSRAEPGSGYLEALFSRFVARVPFENASKILRNAAESDPARKPRRPEVFWREHVETGSGGTCFARVEAFRALVVSLGFSARRALGRVHDDFDHAALFVERDGRAWICDVGYPLPFVLPAEPGEYDGEGATLAISRTDRAFRVGFSDAAPDGAHSIDIFDAPVNEEEFERAWRATFRKDTHFLSGVKLHVVRGGRTVSFAGGDVRVDDRHSRLRVPLLSARPRRLSEIYGMDEALLAGALALAGDPDPASSEASLSAHLETAATPAEAFDAIATREGYRALAEGVARVTSEESTPEGFRFRLGAPEGAGPEQGIEEEVAVDRPALRLSIERRGASAVLRSICRVESREGRTWLVREALFGSPREDLLRNDALRGRLAGSLAVDLLAWARRLSLAGC
ncbi:MAG TPA: arylamine N-acetyltransferase [Thermoanaerobaculia bacterium]|nr:arylamine N-acetyltransferase [Thermoanaerobaculia bacterium]